MKNKRCCSVKYILAKNVRSSGNSIIHHWISMLLTGICGTTANAAVLRVDGGGDVIQVAAGTYYEHVVVNKSVTLQGESNSTTIIDGSGNVVEVTVDGVMIDGFTIQNGLSGIYVTSSNNVFSNNSISNIVGANGISGGAGGTGYSIYLYASTLNLLFHNNLQNEDKNGYDDGSNSWDNGYPSGGNYWSDYTGIDENTDGIGDTPYNISGSAGAQDRYPLMQPWIPDTPPPTVAWNEPTGTNVPVTTQIYMTFSEAMNQASAESAFSTSQVTTGSFTWNNNIMTYTPDSYLTLDTTYTVTIGTGAMDLEDNNMQTERIWQFTTEVVPSSINLIWNPGFESGTSLCLFHTDGTGTFSLAPPSFEGSNAANLALSNGGTNIQLYQHGITLEPDTRYQLSFAARSSTGNDMTVKLLKHISTYTNYGLDYTTDLGTNWQTFTTEFATTGYIDTVNGGRLMFWLAPFGAAVDTYNIDNVLLEKI